MNIFLSFCQSQIYWINETMDRILEDPFYFKLFYSVEKSSNAYLLFKEFTENVSGNDVFFSKLPLTLEIFMFNVEIYLGFSLLVLMLFGSFLMTSVRHNYPLFNLAGSRLLFVVFFFSLLISLDSPNLQLILLNNQFNINALNLNLKSFLIFCSILFVIMCENYLQKSAINSVEYFLLILLNLLSSFLILNSYSLISLYLSIEMQSLILYILTAFKRNSIYSNEGGIKYFVMGAFSSTFLLLGFSIIYLYTGCLNYIDLSYFFDNFFSFDEAIFIIESNLNSGELLEKFNIFLDEFLSKFRALQLAFLLIIAGFLFKVASAPFHLWVSDVYEGAPTNSTIFFATISKVPVIYAFYYLFYFIFTELAPMWSFYVLISAFISILTGSLLALKQHKIKRLLAASSITQTGYMLLTLYLSNTQAGVALYFFIIIYIISSLILWNVVLCLCFNKDIIYNEGIIHFRGLCYMNSSLSFVSLLSILSIAGIPCLPGFISKFLIFLTAISCSKYTLFLILVMVSVVSAYYYLKISKNMFFEHPSLSFFFKLPNYQESLTLSILFMLMIFFVIFPNFLVIISYNINLNFYG